MFYDILLYSTMYTCTYMYTQNASSDVDKMILGNKCDLSESRVVSTERGKLVCGNGSMGTGEWRTEV